MLVTDLPIAEPPLPLPDGLEWRSDGKIGVIWYPGADRHVDVSIVHNRLASSAVHESQWQAALYNLGFGR